MTHGRRVLNLIVLPVERRDAGDTQTQGHKVNLANGRMHRRRDAQTHGCRVIKSILPTVEPHTQGCTDSGMQGHIVNLGNSIMHRRRVAGTHGCRVIKSILPTVDRRDTQTHGCRVIKSILLTVEPQMQGCTEVGT